MVGVAQPPGHRASPGPTGGADDRAASAGEAGGADDGTEVGEGPAVTADFGADGYGGRLDRLSGRSWKRWLRVQAPYRWNLRRLDLGHVLEVGCGIGRNLDHLDGGGVGVDMDPTCVARARARGFEAYLVEEFEASPHARPGAFDSLLVAHVLEHMEPDQAVGVLEAYLPYVRPGGRVVVITPQEAGQRTDPTHVTFLDAHAVKALAGRAGVRVERARSFPFPRVVGRVFPYNETVCVGTAP